MSRSCHNVWSVAPEGARPHIVGTSRCPKTSARKFHQVGPAGAPPDNWNITPYKTWLRTRAAAHSIHHSVYKDINFMPHPNGVAGKANHFVITTVRRGIQSTHREICGAIVVSIIRTHLERNVTVSARNQYQTKGPVLSNESSYFVGSYQQLGRILHVNVRLVVRTSYGYGKRYILGDYCVRNYPTPYAPEPLGVYPGNQLVRDSFYGPRSR